MFKFIKRLLCKSEKKQAVTTEQADKIVDKIKQEVGKKADATTRSAESLYDTMKQEGEAIAIRVYRAAHPN